MIIDRKRVDMSLRNIRKHYRIHTEGGLISSRFVTLARAELNALYFQHTMALINATADRVKEELGSLQAQFGIELEFHDARLTQVTRGYRGLRASMYVRSKTYVYFPGSTEIFIGPFDEWDRIAVHTVEESQEGRPSFYTKRRAGRWIATQDFDFPSLLLQIKEEAEQPAPKFDDDLAF